MELNEDSISSINHYQQWVQFAAISAECMHRMQLSNQNDRELI